MNKFKSFVLILPLLLAACPGSEVNTPPSGSQSNANSTQKAGILNVIVQDGTTQKNIANAQAKIILPDGTVLTKQTDSNGLAIFDNLVEGNSYNVEVSASNYINNSISTSSANLTIKSSTPSSLTIKLYKSLGSFSGKVTSESGQPINAAVIQVGNDSSLSDTNGDFKVNISSLTQQNILISKIGYKNLNYGSVNFSINDKDKNSGTVKIAPNSEPISVIFDLSKKPFGNTSLTSFNNMVEYMSELNYKVSFENFLTKSNTDNIDILLISSPSQNYSDSEIEKINNFIKQGKKLIVLGEWGGYSNFKIDSVNKILLQSNLKINPDVIKETQTSNYTISDEQIISTNITPHFITDKISRLSFYSSASVEIINGGIKSIDTNTTKLLSFSSATGFRIQVFNKGQAAFMGSSLLGLGKVIVLGDSSIFMDNDSNDNGILNINEHNNKQLIKNIFSW